ncbi:MAG TPA: hypothetical protein VMN83_28035 [Albitalea sp.]|nr:hypothetical protein [Albitalea sp.]
MPAAWVQPPSGPRPSLAVRALAAGVALVFALLSLVLVGAGPRVTAAWPWPEMSISFVFLGAITASVATVWASVALSGEFAALAGVGLNIVVAGVPAIVFLGWQVATGAHADLGLALAFAIASSAFGLWLWRATRGLPVHDPRPLPRTVRVAFFAFVVTLVVAGTALAVQRQVFPWRLQPSSATLFGFIFLGAAAFFANAVRSGRWAVAAPALWGFLAYDLVLFVPYGRLLFADTAAADDFYGDGQRVDMASLAVYLTVLAASTMLALHAALVDPATRLWRARDAEHQ